jgi:hypothetical protein
MKRLARRWILVPVGVIGATAAAVVVTLIVRNGVSSLDPAQQRAVDAAKAEAQMVSTVPISFVSVESGRFGDFAPGAGAIVSPPGRQVWAVTFHGKATPSCGPLLIGGTPRRCPALNATIKVILDHATDAAIEVMTVGSAGIPYPS